MEFRGAEEILLENLEALVNEIWYHDIKEIPSIQLPERALVAAKMSLLWKADRRDKPIYVEDKTIVALYVVAYQREKGKMTIVQIDAGEKPWYHQIVRNFALPKDADLEAQPAADVETCACCHYCTQENRYAEGGCSEGGEEKGTRLVSDSWCDYIVVSDSLEGLAPVAVKKQKAESKDTTDIPESNPDDPIDLESSPEPLVRKNTEKRKKPEGGAAAQPAKKMARKKIGKKGNLDAFAASLSLEKAGASSHVVSLFSFDGRVPSPPLELNKENLEGDKSVETDVKLTNADSIKTTPPEVMAVTQGHEKNKSLVEDEPPVVTAPSNSAPSFELPKDNI
ncbi:hypothetical protein HanRHA438_Chr10g0441901 [Helianthus annuus]|uniref:Uncharacterized protein n=1 Tax=Helianthus annuus TaxID=4232 RepID=A0A9K3N389_HELAN|nr:hypothetical protein HanXRQr2_Chr10g0429491 [Helianthus annuus]KAJ0513056.1 hypothetical protein HanHA300_Chr10g0353141 [Helianthus annuus]KAJ0529180.1 hypothetical protein HanHA89_Chr10g0374831 [Helianthus annuus]KAJ0878625.1 hypothetical protein HanRHA438_Chr10g0441901 [Helianthus annuus]